MNKETLKNNAKSFYLAALRCDEKRELDQNQLEWFVVPTVVNLAFSIELGLKYILIFVEKNPHGHNLLNLFESIPNHIKSKIVDLAGTSEEDFRHDLDIHSKIFTEWRYLHERNDGNVNLDFLQKCAKLLVISLIPSLETV